MRKFLTWVLAIPVGLVLIAFAVANRDWIKISFDPLSQSEPFFSISVPVWSLFFAGLIAGVIWGWAVGWLSQGRWRKTARAATADLQAVRAENARLRERGNAGGSGALVPVNHSKAA